MTNAEKKFNKIIIITAPSGSGKTSIVKHLMEKYPRLAFSISATTRPPRANEKDGIDYYFIGHKEFEKNIHEKKFLEWEMVYEGRYYGTLKSEMDRIWSLGKVPVLDIDVHGAIHVMHQYPVNTFAIFIQAPSIEALKNRLQSRGTETAETLQARLDKSSYEMTFKSKFKHIIVNDVFEQACDEADKKVGEFLQTP